MLQTMRNAVWAVPRGARANFTGRVRVPPITRALPRYFELFQNHHQTFQRFESDPKWIIEALTKQVQSTQSYYVEDALRQQYRDSLLLMAEYFCVTHGCRVLETKRSRGEAGLLSSSSVLLESPSHSAGRSFVANTPTLSCDILRKAATPIIPLSDQHAEDPAPESPTGAGRSA